MPVDIQIVSPPNLAKIESFFKDSSYRETIEFSANFNTRLCVERRLRLPFLDPQTGVAQNHSQLFIDQRQRMPGLREGQIYTYPAARWRKSRRQYLNKMYRFNDRPFQALRKEHDTMIANSSSLSSHSAACTASPSIGIPHHENDLINGTFLEESSSLGAAGGDTSDSKDSQQQQLQTQSQQHLKEDLSKEWFYDDMDMNDVDSLEEPKSPADDEYDYDPRYGTKKARRKRRAGKRAMFTPGEGSTRRRSGGRGRGSSAAANSDLSFSGVDAIDAAVADSSMTPTTTSGRRSRGTRGRRRTKGNACDQPLSPGLNCEPPSFESAAAAVGVNDNTEEHADLRNYRKYL